MKIVLVTLAVTTLLVLCWGQNDVGTYRMTSINDPEVRKQARFAVNQKGSGYFLEKIMKAEIQVRSGSRNYRMTLKVKVNKRGSTRFEKCKELVRVPDQGRRQLVSSDCRRM